MGKKLYVGNLPYSADDQSLQALFSQYGSVQSVNLITDRDTGRSKGFGFVEMGSDSDAQRAIESLNGHDMDGRKLTVNEARPKEPRGNNGRSGGGFARARGW
ncbi:MAG: RNA-binding protein [Gammaproteobacteria bacterium]|nr:RNA-binding protein [Gammaproteobacteria bacterium]MDH4254408.1 RNA-binding protein [Gammaproteobacteria bacterium]MDH5310761.1 RNA-binding protein [Gammaproteobacteria bacterium]